MLGVLLQLNQIFSQKIELFMINNEIKRNILCFPNFLHVKKTNATPIDIDKYNVRENKPKVIIENNKIKMYINIFLLNNYNYVEYIINGAATI